MMHFLFVYCNLKLGRAFHSEIKNRGAILLDSVVTEEKYPLVVRSGEAYLLDLPGEGSQVNGELYQLNKEIDLDIYFKCPKEASVSEIVVKSEKLGSCLAKVYLITRRDLASLYSSGKLVAKDSF